ncbi:TMEM175 family protein [Methanosphaera sp.]
METERFEALIDAILAIIVTLIILELELPATPTFTALFELKQEFFIYAVSFFVIYNIWNTHHNLFTKINKLTDSVIWTSIMSVFIVTFLPYTTEMVMGNFNNFFAQLCFGSVFFISHVYYIIQAAIIRRTDPANIALQVYLKNGMKYSAYEVIAFIIIFLIGYLYYPPIIIYGCLFVMILWLIADQYIPTIREYLSH